ncbi:MAG: hypothetical protein JJE46_08310 [Acidimicrobiia bacterium]|nr:hypothetical protein [Acidimicrobiia bacterium]
MTVVRDVLLWCAGIALIVVVVDAAIRTFVLPRGAVVRLTRVIAVGVRSAFDVRLRFCRTYEQRDRVMAMYSPIVLLAFVTVWLAMLVGAFTMIFLAVDGDGIADALTTAGSSLFTLGFERPPTTVGTIVAFGAASFGLGLVALLIAYLPTLYGAFSRREVLVAYMAARAGTPARPVDLLIRAQRIGRLDDLDDLWVRAQDWFAELEETHTSLPLLSFFRSPTSDRSWITAAGAILDSAALVNSTVDVPFQPMAGLCIRSGFTALRAIGGFFNIPSPADPRPDDRITIGREEWERVCDELLAAGVPLKADRDQAWRDFAGWRVNYDVVLVTLAGLVLAPPAPWSSDRSVRFRVAATSWGRRRRSTPGV